MIIGLTFLYELIKIKSVMTYLTYVREQIAEACVIQIFGVDPKYQGQGIATKFLQRQVEECRSKGIKLVRVMLEERDDELQKFFKRLGFDRGHDIDFSKILGKSLLRMGLQRKSVLNDVKFRT